jgi:DNA-binding NarL/FixJ family response regulator
MSGGAVAALRPAVVPTPTAKVIAFPGATRPRADTAAARQIQVLVAHGQPLMRAGLQALLTGGKEIAVAAVAGDADEAVAVARRDRPDVVLMDIDLPGPGAIEATRRMLADPGLAEVKIVIVAAKGEDRVTDALLAGASGVLCESAEPADLIEAVSVLARGRALLAHGITRRAIAALASRPVASRRDPDHRAIPLPINLSLRRT